MAGYTRRRVVRPRCRCNEYSPPDVSTRQDWPAAKSVFADVSSPLNSDKFRGAKCLLERRAHAAKYLPEAVEERCQHRKSRTSSTCVDHKGDVVLARACVCVCVYMRACVCVFVCVCWCVCVCYRLSHISYVRRFSHLPSKADIAKIVLRDLDLFFEDQQFPMLIFLKQWEQVTFTCDLDLWCQFVIVIPVIIIYSIFFPQNTWWDTEENWWHSAGDIPCFNFFHATNLWPGNCGLSCAVTPYGLDKLFVEPEYPYHDV